ncbi:MAG: biotin/lipoyl-binding protein [Ruminococcus sp.]|nr:biotin/lipoyl-binding protein [Ruminococcus sp.]
MKRFSIISVISAFVMMLTAAGCSSEDEAEEIVIPIYETDEIDYRTEEAVVGDISQKYYADANFGYPYSETVSFSMSGTIESVNVADLDTVSKGDILCTLNSDELDSQLEEKEVYVEQAEKTLETLKESGGSATEIELAQTDLELLQLEYDYLEASRDNYNVYAPCDGVFKASNSTAFSSDISDQRGADVILVEGATVSASQSFGTIEDHSQEYLICDVYDITLENVNFGTRVTLTQTTDEATGKVVDIIEGDNSGMSQTTYVILPDEGSGLSDMTVSCCFEVYSKLDTVIVPSDAVKTSGDRSYVNLLIDGTKIEQDVEVGIVDGDETEITSGLSGGEQVIVN